MDAALLIDAVLRQTTVLIACGCPDGQFHIWLDEHRRDPPTSCALTTARTSVATPRDLTLSTVFRPSC